MQLIWYILLFESFPRFNTGPWLFLMGQAVGDWHRWIQKTLRDVYDFQKGKEKKGSFSMLFLGPCDSRAKDWGKATNNGLLGQTRLAT